MRRSVFCVLIAAVLLAVPSAKADDVTGVEHMVCAPMVVHECRTDSGCASGPPWEHDIGPFFEIDLKNRRMASTERDRSTEIRDIQRDGELVVVQGYEMGRAFSLVISQSSGFLSGSITLDDGVLTVFGACKKFEGGK